MKRETERKTERKIKRRKRRVLLPLALSAALLLSACGQSGQGNADTAASETEAAQETESGAEEQTTESAGGSGTADGAVYVIGGTIDITESEEGIEGATIDVLDGEISIVSRDDGMNATNGTSKTENENTGMQGEGARPPEPPTGSTDFAGRPSEKAENGQDRRPPQNGEAPPERGGAEAGAAGDPAGKTAAAGGADIRTGERRNARHGRGSAAAFF